MRRPRALAVSISKATTRLIGTRWGTTFPFFYVSEHPRSGGTWVARMVADYLQLPYPQHSLFPLGFSCVIRNEWNHDPRLRPAFYVYRDGRDVLTSFFFEIIRESRYTTNYAADRQRVRRRYEKVLGRDYRAEDIVELLPRFIEYQFTHPAGGTRLNWRDHIRDWYRPDERPEIGYVRYEDLLADCRVALGRALEGVTGELPDPWRLETTVEKFDMKRHTGRKPGEEDRTDHIRKGVAGDWRNYFSREAAALFDELAGDTLVELGYEPDRDWVKRYEYADGLAG